MNLLNMDDSLDYKILNEKFEQNLHQISLQDYHINLEDYTESVQKERKEIEKI